MSETVYIGLGANLGDREQQLLRAVELVGRIDAVAILRRSSLYDSASVGPTQPRFLNAVIEIECGLNPQRLLAICKRIEQELGRMPGGPRWGPREIDLDLLVWDGRVIADPNLQVPHLELHKRRFALEPLAELTPRLVHPVLHITMEELLRKSTTQDVVRVDSANWRRPVRQLLEQLG